MEVYAVRIWVPTFWCRLEAVIQLCAARGRRSFRAPSCRCSPPADWDALSHLEPPLVGGAAGRATGRGGVGPAGARLARKELSSGGRKDRVGGVMRRWARGRAGKASLGGWSGFSSEDAQKARSQGPSKEGAQRSHR
jgi:hypothetical protein